MAADVDAIRRWLLDESLVLQRQQEATSTKLAVVRSIMRLLAAATHEPQEFPL